jgi:predicted transcriptional regulator
LEGKLWYILFRKDVLQMWLDRLKEMKRESGLTTKEIAIRSGVPEPTLVKIFAGVTKEPKLTTIQQVVHFLGHTLDDLEDSPVVAVSLANALTEQEEKLLSDFRSLDKDGKEFILHAMAMTVSTHSGKNKAVSDMETAQ